MFRRAEPSLALSDGHCVRVVVLNCRRRRVHLQALLSIGIVSDVIEVEEREGELTDDHGQPRVVERELELEAHAVHSVVAGSVHVLGS